jgi:hypothetical protein
MSGEDGTEFKNHKASFYYDRVLSGVSSTSAASFGSEADLETSVEYVHWLVEPTTWITAEHTGEDAKSYNRKWHEELRLFQESAGSVEAQISGHSIDFKTFKWSIRQLKDHVLIMRAIVDLAAAEVTAMKSRKIMRAPAEKFYSRVGTTASVLVFLCGVGSGIMELFDAAPAWVVLLFFILSSVLTYGANVFAERWGARERRRRKLQKVVEQRGQIATAKTFIDAMDFDEMTVVAIMQQRARIHRKYRGDRAKRELARLGRAVSRQRVKSNESPKVIRRAVIKQMMSEVDDGSNEASNDSSDIHEGHKSSESHKRIKSRKNVGESSEY